MKILLVAALWVELEENMSQHHPTLWFTGDFWEQKHHTNFLLTRSAFLFQTLTYWSDHVTAPVHNCVTEPIQLLEERVIPLCSHTHFSMTAQFTIPLHSLGIQGLKQVWAVEPAEGWFFLLLTSDFVAASCWSQSLRLRERKEGLPKTKQWV